jgi:hypothetical protein
MLKRDTDLEVGRSTMDGWVQVGELLLPIVRVGRGGVAAFRDGTRAKPQ